MNKNALYHSLAISALLSFGNSASAALTVAAPSGGTISYDSATGNGSFQVNLTQAGVGQQFQDPNRVVVMTVNFALPPTLFTSASDFSFSIGADNPSATVAFDSAVDIPTGTTLGFTFSYDTPLWARGADGVTVNGVTAPDFTGLPLASTGAALGTAIRAGGFRGFYDGTITSVVDDNQGVFISAADISSNLRYLGNATNRPPAGSATFLSTLAGNAGLRGGFTSTDNEISSIAWSLTAVTDIAADSDVLTFTTDGALEAVPEPSSALLASLALLGLAARRRR